MTCEARCFWTALAGCGTMYASQTEASWARSAKLTEFQRVKEAVRRLEHTSREQLVRAHSPARATDPASTGVRPPPARWKEVDYTVNAHTPVFPPTSGAREPVGSEMHSSSLSGA